MSKVTFYRAWAMPSKDTYRIKPITKFIVKHIKAFAEQNRKPVIVDMFAGNSPFIKYCKYSNDLDPTKKTTHHMDALQFLQLLPDNSCDIILFDPPYSSRQVAECYHRHNMAVNMETTQGSFWAKLKKEIQRIGTPESIVLSFGWNSGGVGKKYGYELQEILLVAHGGTHNDTIVTVEKAKAK